MLNAFPLWPVACLILIFSVMAAANGLEQSKKGAVFAGVKHGQYKG